MTTNYDVYLERRRLLKPPTTPAHSTPPAQNTCDKELPQDESKLVTLLTNLSKHGQILVVVDQPASLHALTIEVARSQGIDVAYLPGTSQAPHREPCTQATPKPTHETPTSLGEAARSMPHALRRTDTGDEELTNLKMMIGYGRRPALVLPPALATASAACCYRYIGALEHVLGPDLDNDGVLKMLAETGGPSGMRRWARSHASQAYERWCPA